LVDLIGTVLLQVAAVYLPGLQQASHTTALLWGDWGLILNALFTHFLNCRSHEDPAHPAHKNLTGF
jgi:hypothetical protein